MADLGKPRFHPREDYTDHDIVKIYYWAVLHDRPNSWALQRCHWPVQLRRHLPLPASGTFSERLRSRSVQDLLTQLERRVVAPKEPGLFGMSDGQPLVISGGSKDRQAGYGRAAGGKAKGSKLHAVVGSDGSVACGRLAPLNKDERVLAERLVKAAPPAVVGSLSADGNYDSNPLHRTCAARGDLQRVTPRRYGPGKGTGHRPPTAGRLRSLALTESPFPAFADQLRQDRAEIERQFGQLTNWGGGLSGLPAWVRTHRRVQAKLVLTTLKRQLRQTTYVA